jgi:succinate dehydrogenase / fumarate reductase, cytochrome b subunit
MQRVGWFQSSSGNRVVISLTGLGLVGFVVFHMLGNLQVFEGPDALNTYAAMLRDMPMFLWTARIGLLGVAIFHIALAIQLVLRNRRARPVGYALREYRHASVASRTMALTGSVLLVFVVLHRRSVRE